MSYTSLVAPKGTTGSVANWVGYSKLDIPVIVDEAQALLYSLLRVREMRTSWTFGIPVGGCKIALPSRFLDPIGRMRSIEFNMPLRHRIESEIVDGRSYDPSPAGTYATDPFTTVAGSSHVTAVMAAHGLNQGSTITNSGATPVGGLTMTGVYPIISIIDVNTFVFDVDVDGGAASSATGGGSAATWTANNLVAGSPSRWAVYDEAVQFDSAFDTATTFKLLYFRSPILLSGTNLSNWVTNRYPNLMRQACVTSSAAFMKDDNEYQKGLTALQGLIGQVSYEGDLMYRGAELETDTP